MLKTVDPHTLFTFYTWGIIITIPLLSVFSQSSMLIEEGLIKMFMNEQNDRLDIYILNNEILYFGKLANYLHKSINEPISIFITFAGSNIKGLELVENFEVLCQHTDVNDVTFIVEPTNPKYTRIERAIRFMREVHGIELTLMTGTSIEMIELQT